MGGHQINVGLDDIALRKAAKKAIEEAVAELDVISRDELVAALKRWGETAGIGERDWALVADELFAFAEE